MIWSPVHLLEPQLETAPLTFTVARPSSSLLFLSLVIFISFGFNVTSETPRLASLDVGQQQVLVGKPLKALRGGLCVCVLHFLSYTAYFDKQINDVITARFFHFQLLTKVKLFLERAVHAFVSSLLWCQSVISEPTAAGPKRCSTVTNQHSKARPHISILASLLSLFELAFVRHCTSSLSELSRGPLL